MFLRKENQNNRQDNSDNTNQLRTNLLSEDYGENDQIEYQTNNSNRQSRGRISQNNNQSQNNNYQSPQRIQQVRDQNVELEKKSPHSDTEYSEKRRSNYVDQGEEKFNSGSINNLAFTEQIVFSRGSFRQSEDGVEENQNNVVQNQEQNEQQNEEDQIQKISVLYLKSLRQFLQGQKLNLCYSFVKIFVGAILLLLSSGCLFNNYTLWVILLICQSFIAIIYNIRSVQLMQQPLFAEEIAIDLHQIEMFQLDSTTDDYVDYIMVDDQIQFGNEMAEQEGEHYRRQVLPLHQIPYHSYVNQEEDFRKISMMVLQLKYECKKRDNLAMITGYTQFFFHLGLQLWAVIQFFVYDNMFDNLYKNYECTINLQRFIFIVVLIGVFQYLDYYIIIGLILICNFIHSIYSQQNQLSQIIKNYFYLKDLYF